MGKLLAALGKIAKFLYQHPDEVAAVIEVVTKLKEAKKAKQ